MSKENFFFKIRGELFVFALTFIFFLPFHFSSNNLVGYDSYMYIKLAEMVKDGGLIKEFPWINATIMKDNFTGLHFAYYILLIPFTFFGNLIFGAKLASLFFFSFLTAIFYRVLKYLKLKKAFLWQLFFLSSSSYFILRMNFTRPISFSVILLLVLFYALFKRNGLLVFITSFFYVWSHGSFPLVLFFALTFAVIDSLHRKKIMSKNFICSLFGLLLGILINPFFPSNVYVYFLTYFSLSVPYFFTAKISELRPMNSLQIFNDASVLFVLFLLLALFFVVKKILTLLINKKELNKTEDAERIFIIDFLLAISLSFFMLMFFIGRFVDYWVPFAVLFVAFSAEFLYHDKKNIFWRKIKKINSHKFSREKIKFVFISFFVIYSCISIYNKAFVVARSAKENTSENIKEMSLWLKNNTPERSIVFNTYTGDFPKFFFYNTHNYYVLGIDERFMYIISPEKYWLYTHIREGVVCNKKRCDLDNTKNSKSLIYDTLKKEFNAEYVLIQTGYSSYDSSELIGVLNSDPRFEKVYENEGGGVWEVK